MLLEREPYADNSALIMALVERKQSIGYLCATTLTTIHYLACKTIGNIPGRQAIQTLLQIYQIAPVDHKVLQMALNTGFKDYEDSVLYTAGVNAGASAIITRNVKVSRVQSCRFTHRKRILLMLRARSKAWEKR